MEERPSTRTPAWQVLLLVLLAALLHVVGAVTLLPTFLNWNLGTWEAPVSVRLLDGDALDALTPDQLARLEELESTQEEPVPVEEPEEPEPVMPDGQVVETVKPLEEKIPLQSDYLDDHDNAVPEETRTAAYKVNPEVLSNAYSREAKMALEDLADVGATDISTGATVGQPGDDAPGKGPPRSLLPSKWTVTNKEGVAAPTRASSRDQELAGAPQNDLLNEKLGATVALNTREFVGSRYINRIRAMVNPWWSQCVQNLPASLPWSKSSYTTKVAIVLDANGALEQIDITTKSGIDPSDNCVIQAFQIAGPFPNPPEQLIAKDGRVYLDDFGFTVELGQAHNQYQGIDPRAGVQFPGILKSPR